MFAAGKTSTSAAAQLYVDDVFSTYLYTGNGSTQTITNGIDLAGKGGMVWIKERNTISSHSLFDTTRGSLVTIGTNNTDANFTLPNSVTAFNANGFSVGNATRINSTGIYASWTFREAQKFFDVVTYTGDGVSGRSISHNLTSTPGFIVIKRTDTTGAWICKHASESTRTYQLNSSNASSGAGVNLAVNGRIDTFNSSSFSVVSGDTNIEAVNGNGGSYVAYLFANNSGGFGSSGAENVITCGSYTGNGSATGPVVTLGYEPQWLLIKGGGGANWQIIDNMRGMSVGSNDATLQANETSAEASVDYISPTSTGFQVVSTNTQVNANGVTYIYLAIRRPNKPPTTGTQVFSPNAVNVATGTAITTNFPIDLQIFSLRTGATNKNNVYDRLRGISSNTTESGVRLITDTTAAETAIGNETLGWDNTGFKMTSVFSGTSDIFWNFRRAPGVFDEVCYTGTGASTTQAHNLGAVPELMIVKLRNAVGTWMVYDAFNGNTKYLQLDTASVPSASSAIWNNTTPTTNVFTVGTNSAVNGSGSPYVAYLFATVAGISKVFSYTGNGTSQTINCGFTTGARFVLIKRTDSTGDWYVWDSARGIVAGNDPHLSLNTTAAEVTTNDSVDTDSTGFVVNQLAATNVNVTSATYIGLAFA